MIWPQRWANDSAIGLALDPEPALAQRHAVLAVLPLDVPVARFLERERGEAGGQHRLQAHRLLGDVLRAGTYEPTAHRSLQVAPTVDLAHEAHFQPGRIRVVVVVRIRR